MKTKKILLTSIFFLISLSITPIFSSLSKGKIIPSNPIENTVCIDPGHGGSDTGAINGDIYEKNINLEVADLLRDMLEKNGYGVFMTRESDVYKTNADRYNYCNSKNTEILISIHHNGSTDTSIDYTTALYMKTADTELAKEVSKTVSEELSLTNKGISRFASGVLLKSYMPATISEGFFLTNSDEYSLIKNEGRLEQEAEALFKAIDNYLN